MELGFSADGRAKKVLVPESKRMEEEEEDGPCRRGGRRVEVEEPTEGYVGPWD